MTAITSDKRRPRPAYRADQRDAPATTRAADLVRLARFIADNTSPAQAIRLTLGDSLRLKMLLPRTPLRRSRQVLLSMVTDLHSARQAEDLAADGHLDWVEASAGDFYRSADGTARDAVQADLKAGAR